MSPIRLVLLTIALVLVVFIINILLLVLGIDPFLLAIVSGCLLLVWFILFIIAIVWFYLYPRALYKDVFDNWNFKVELAPTLETYTGIYNDVPIKVQFMKGRWHTTVYIYFETDHPYSLAIGRSQPLQTNNVTRLNNLPEEYRDLIVLSDSVLPDGYLADAKIKRIVTELIQKYNAEIYWEKDVIKIRLPSLVNPGDVRQVICESGWVV